MWGILWQLMAMAHMQRAGHRPIVLLGGGTGMIGDPSRQNGHAQDDDHGDDRPQRGACFRKQIGQVSGFFRGERRIMVDNGDWLRNLNYIEFLREVGAHFSVNRMLTAECYQAAAGKRA